MDHHAAVERVAGEPIGMPGEDTVGLATFDTFYQVVEDGPSGRLGASGFLQHGHNSQLLAFCIPLELIALRFDRKDLAIFGFRRFTTVDKIPIQAFGRGVDAAFAFTLQEIGSMSNGSDAVALTSRAGLEIVIRRWLPHEKPQERQQFCTRDFRRQQVRALGFLFQPCGVDVPL